MKRIAILVAALLSILLITRLEDYLGQQGSNAAPVTAEQVSYYFTDFNSMKTEGDGHISQQINGQHLSHWQAKKESHILAPVIDSSDQQGNKTHLTAKEAHINHATEEVKLMGDAHIRQPSKDGNGELNLYTDHLTYTMPSHEVTTDVAVSITSPSGTMQSVGMTGKLDEDLLRFKSNVRSTYQVK
jgi:LPS export ABC transporter protein LptC